MTPWYESASPTTDDEQRKSKCSGHTKRRRTWNPVSRTDNAEGKHRIGGEAGVRVRLRSVIMRIPFGGFCRFNIWS
ncbi:hypothetical protein LIA77_00802 [Sarocladium implicatum]|nr:hypothetical protein LIA77_00802 [Sarocladium implicatum]